MNNKNYLKIKKKNVMKKFKLLFLVTTIVISMFYSCSDDNAAGSDQNVEKSIGLRTVMNNIKKASNIAGKSSQTTSLQPTLFGFDFVYPLTLSYNNGTVITVASFAGLIEVLTNENENLYIDGIEFPFQVIVSSDGSTLTIDNEEELWDFIETLDIETIDDYAFSQLCYDFVYPFSLVLQNNQTIVISNQNDLLALFTNPNAQTVILDFVYPFSVIYDGETIVVNDVYEYFELTNNCVQTICDCPLLYEPVCVNTPQGVEDFPNACYAECAGYTAANFVNCNATGPNDFGGLGTCYNIIFPIQVQYQGATVSITNNNQLLTFLTNSPGAIINYPIELATIPTQALPVSITVIVDNTAGLNNFTTTFCN